uniref:Type I substrate-binding unit n=1 Tax=Endomicrobium trichonymphae TaxID=1408204 RepID=A0A1C9ZTB3_ENDTX|nr:type I substrate-binding unit [Candidatus Endomicrobium trichonymphae]
MRINSKWEVKKLGEICDIELGKTPYRGNASFWDKDKNTKNVWLSIADLLNAQNKIILDSKEYISNKGTNISKIVKKGTLLLSFKLTLGRLAFAGKDLYTNEAIAALGIKCDKILKEYLYYYFSVFDWDSLVTGDVKVKGKTLNKKKLNEINVCYPAISEQEKTVARLDKFSENIKRLEDTARKNLQNAKDLFSSVLNEMLLTKRIRKYISLENVCKKIVAGGDKPTSFSEISTEKYNVPIYANAVKNDGLCGFTNKSIIVEEAITISARGTIGFVCAKYKPFYPIVRLIVAIPDKQKVVLEFLVYALKHIMLRGSGTSIPQLTVPEFKKNKILLPTLSEQKKIVAKLDKLSAETKKLEIVYQKKIDGLAELKKSVLKQTFNCG